MAKDKRAVSKTTVAVKKDDAKPGFGKRTSKWFRDMKGELNKVSWPTAKTTTNNTVVTLTMTIGSAVVLWGFDELAQLAVKALLTLAG